MNEAWLSQFLISLAIVAGIFAFLVYTKKVRNLRQSSGFYILAGMVYIPALLFASLVKSTAISWLIIGIAFIGVLVLRRIHVKGRLFRRKEKGAIYL